VTPKHLIKRLRQMAAERGTSMAELIREALEDEVANHRTRPRSLGLGAPAMRTLPRGQATSDHSHVRGADPGYGSALRHAGSDDAAYRSCRNLVEEATEPR
jgi:hypothetical protein